MLLTTTLSPSRDAGISNGALATLLIGTVNVLATGLGVYLMERAGACDGVITRVLWFPSLCPHSLVNLPVLVVGAHHTGRRPLIVYGALTMLFASLGLTVMLALNVRAGAGWCNLLLVPCSRALMSCTALDAARACLMQKYHDGNAATGVFAVIFIMVFVTGFEVGLGPIPWAIGTEVFAEDARATAMGA